MYCGPIDEYFDHRLGKLPYRSLRFEFVPYDAECVQPCVQINYPNDFAYTRSVEIKHVTGQKHPHTVVSYETPAASRRAVLPGAATRRAARCTRATSELADAETVRYRVFFCGRLAQYRYFNTDEVIQEALACFQTDPRRCALPRHSASSA